MKKENERKITKICLIIFIVSFFSLIYFENNYEIPNKKINEIDYNSLNNVFTISGNIVSSNIHSSNLFLEVCDNLSNNDDENKSCIDVVAFDIEKLDEKSLKNKNIEIIGKVVYYNQKLELIAKKIKFVE